MIVVDRIEAGDLSAEITNWHSRSSLIAHLALGGLWATVGGRVVVWTATDDGKIVAGIPGVEFGRGWLCRFQSMPDGLYSPLIFDQDFEGDRSEVVQQIIASIVKYRYMRTFLYDYHSQLGHAGDIERQLLSTHVADISSSDWQPPDKKLRSEIAKAERESISIQSFNRERHLERFMALMQGTEKRHGRAPKYPESFYARLAELAETDERVEWVWCEHESRPVASHIFLIESDMALHWQVFFDKLFSFLKPNQYILFNTAKKLAGRGVRYLNLGASPECASGLVAYKEKWGAKVVSYPMHCHRSLLGRFI